MFKRVVTSEKELRELMGTPSERAIKKESPFIDEPSRQFIAHSPFLLLATSDGQGRCDVSPKGDAPGFVRVLDEHHLVIPDRPGNKRLDGLRNLLINPHVGTIFLIPGREETLRVNGRAYITTDPALCATFEMQRQVPKSLIVVEIEKVYFQCTKALVRSKLWDPASQIKRTELPSVGELVAATMKGADAAEYDRIYPERIKQTIY